MLQDIMLGQFFPGNSLIYKLDPRVKIFSLFTLILLIFTLKSWQSYLLILFTTFVLVILLAVPFLIIIKSLKPLKWLILFTLLVHSIDQDGEEIFNFLVFNITFEGIKHGIFISLRISLMIMLSNLVTFTTTPLQLTNAMEKILSPLRRIGVNPDELALMMMIAIRFVPTLLEETDKILKAQKSRGLDFDSRNVFKRLQALIAILVPLFLSCFRRAEDLALAMEARCYDCGIVRTHMKRLKLTKKDFVATIVVILICIGIGYLDHAI